MVNDKMVNDQMVNEQYLARCIELARRGEYYVAPNPMVGAVLVNAGGDIIAEGWHEQYGGP
ncbi:MAG: riboflavin biosynthesis protein RibD, partial [Paludibacteraceae bacterium]|nr:riboflavin biosynthesis protein RibD [Paludibacteraceae bacterium]